MRKLLLMASMLGSIPPPARAQPELGVALKAGPNAANVTKDNRVSRYGLSGGLAGYLRRPLVGRYSLAGQVELLYTPRGSELIFEGEYLAMSRFHYFDLTVAARPEVRVGAASVFLLLGGGLNLLLRANSEDASGMARDVTRFLHRVDVALIVGAGVAVHLPGQKLGPLGLGTVFFEARHDHGLLETDAVLGGIKNRSSSLLLGLSFTLASGAPAPAGTPPAAAR